MNYQKIMESLIYKRTVLQPLIKSRSMLGQIEQHHIVMRSMNGTNDKSNLVNLTVREHYFIHELLVQIYKNTKYELTVRRAWNGMSRKMGKDIKSSRLYQKFRLEYNKHAGDSVRGKISYTNGIINKYFSKNENIPNGWYKGRKPLTEQALKNKRLAAQRGYIRVNNGKKEISIKPDNIPDGFVKGCLRRETNKGKIVVNNGIIQKYVYPNNIPQGFTIGSLPCTAEHMQFLKNIYANMSIDKKIERNKKISMKLKGKSNWAKGTKQSQDHIDKRTNKIRGLKRTKQQCQAIRNRQIGKIKVNNGIKTIYADPNNIPDGFIRGQLHKQHK